MMNKYEYKTMINNMAVYLNFFIKMTDKKGTSFRFTASSGSNIFAFEKLANQKSHAPFGPDLLAKCLFELAVGFWRFRSNWGSCYEDLL